FLGCPYTDEIDEAAVLNLLTNPGEIRLKILHWLFCRYDSELAEFLEPGSYSLGARNDSRLQRLLSAAHALCLCGSNDVELIKGTAPYNDQIEFVNRFLDLLCFKEKGYSLDSTLYTRPDMYNSQLNMLITQDGFLTMFDSCTNLLPRDIHMEVDNLKMKQRKTNKTQTLQDLLTLSETLSLDIQTSQQKLSALQKEMTLEGEDKDQEVLMMSHMLSTILKELWQLSDGFKQCYMSNIKQWCNKSPPELSQLGDTIQTVHGCLCNFKRLLSNMNEIRQTQTKINKLVKKEFTGFPVTIDEGSKEISESLQQCLSVLEETLHRCDSRFKSNQPTVLTV
ncbi:HAUS augmin-like complex subunit 7, partial [Biomphalaria pfeifferi]